MRIAIPYEDGQIFQHFGHTKQFRVYDMAEGGVCTTQMLTPTCQGHEEMSAFLLGEDVDVLICGGIGSGAQTALLDMGITVCSGVQGDADAAADEYFAGTLVYSSEVTCHHHDGGEEHSCGSCGGGCGGCSGCGGHAAEPYDETRTLTEIVDLTADNFEQEVMRDPGLLLILFGDETSEQCRDMMAIFEELNGEEDKVKFCRVNTEKETDLATLFAIDTIPTLALVQNRHSLTGIFGLTDKETIRLMIGCYR